MQISNRLVALARLVFNHTFLISIFTQKRPLYSTQQSPIRLQHLKISGQIGILASRQLLKQISTGGYIDQGFEWLGLLFRLLRHQTNISRIKIGGPFTEALVAWIIDLGTQTAVSTSQGTSPKLLIPPAPKLLSPAAPNFSIPPAPMPFTAPKPAKFLLEPPPRLYKRL
ncbi:hypothetical protein H4Q26_009336 [Puccinia striiformis f. sp. tritici PST-130]|nr:hypothetical protein H4Q26_009336 [Puccinia striiformis f. sp. tritici PST-130]